MHESKEQATVLMKRFEKYGIKPKQKMSLYDAIGLCLDIADKLQAENEKYEMALRKYGCHSAGCTANGPGGCNCGLLRAQGLLQAKDVEEDNLPKFKDIIGLYAEEPTDGKEVQQQRQD